MRLPRLAAIWKALAPSLPLAERTLSTANSKQITPEHGAAMTLVTSAPICCQVQAQICSVVSQDPPAKTKIHTQKITNKMIVLQALRHTIGNTAFLLKSQGKQPKQPVKTYPVLEQFAMQGRTVGGRSLVCVCPRPSPRPAPSPAVYHFATSQSCNRGRCVL